MIKQINLIAVGYFMIHPLTRATTRTKKSPIKKEKKNISLENVPVLIELEVPFLREYKNPI